MWIEKISIFIKLFPEKKRFYHYANEKNFRNFAADKVSYEKMFYEKKIFPLCQFAVHNLSGMTTSAKKVLAV
jgi:hypothetical protein